MTPTASGAAGWLALALLAAPPAGAAEGWVGAIAGGGFDSNPNLGVNGGPGPSAVSATALAFAGGAVLLGERAEISLETRWESTRYQELEALGLDRAGLNLALALDAAEWLRLRLSADAGWRLAVDPARDGWDASGTLGARLRLHRRLALRGSVGLLRREALDPLLRGDVLRWRGGAEVRLGDAAWIGGAWTLEQGAGATASLATVQALSGYLSLPLSGGLSLELGARRAWVDEPGLAGLALSGSAALAWVR